MKGDNKVIKMLNDALSIELAAVNQYFLHARMYKNWGLHALGKHEYEESIEEMHHADLLIERILYLEGLPAMRVLDKLRIGDDVPKCLAGDLELETTGRAHYVESIAYCESVQDFVSRDILQKILGDTEEHIDYLETQIGLVEKTGLENYLQTAAGSMEG
jgi:bacterioferritin